MVNRMQHGLTTNDKHICRKTSRQIEEAQKIKCEDIYNQIKTLSYPQCHWTMMRIYGK